MDWHYGSRWTTIATSTGTTTSIWIVLTSLSDVIDVDLHSDLSLEHCGSCCGTSFILQSKWKWRKHTMLKISNLKRVGNILADGKIVLGLYQKKLFQWQQRFLSFSVLCSLKKQWMSWVTLRLVVVVAFAVNKSNWC